MTGTSTILDGHDYFSHHRRFSPTILREFTNHQVKVDDEIIRRLDRPYEKLEYERYRQIFVNEKRISRGVDFYNQYRFLIHDTADRFGVDAGDVVGEDLERLSPMVDDGLVRIEGGRIEVTGAGRPFVRNVCMAFDHYLERDPAERRYSRTM